MILLFVLEPQLNYCARTLHCYTPNTNAELHLHTLGETITEVVILERGWCKVHN